MRTATLADETDWAGFRQAARQLLAEGVAPEDVIWQVAGRACGELFGGQTPATPRGGPPVMTPSIPAALLPWLESAMLHTDTGRLGLIYRVVWRLQKDPALRRDPLDADVLVIRAMAREVHRDMHKMRAFVRFRPIEQAAAEPLHVAWFEPVHHIVEANAPFFARRFTAMQWAILTPRRSIRWDGAALHTGPGAHRDEAPGADAGEALWLTYYRHIFNPARLKLDMMRKEMPRRYWKNLPEATLIGPLAAQAAERSGRMVAAEPTIPRRRIVPLAPAQAKACPGPGNGALPGAADLRHQVQQCRACPIGDHATQAVWGEGPVHARLMIVGEQPGDQEDLRGQPFVGPAGQLLDQGLAAAGAARAQAYLTNAVKHFKFEPRGKRRLHKSPSQREALACAQWLEQELDTVRPERLLALGATAARALLGPGVSVSAARGRWLPGPRGVPVMVTLHPAALLRMAPDARAAAYQGWVEDLRRAWTLTG